jgi:hypothetical protein
LSECRHRIFQQKLLETKAQIFRYPLFYGEIIFGTGTGNRILVMEPGPDFSEYLKLANWGSVKRQQNFNLKTMKIIQI